MRCFRMLGGTPSRSLLIAGMIVVVAGGTAVAAQQGGQVPPLEAAFQPAGSQPASPDEDGFIRRWMLLEPISKPNPRNTVFTSTYVRDALNPKNLPVNFTTIPRNGQIVKAEAPLRWHALDSKTFDVKLFNMAQSLGKPTYGVIFNAVTVIDSPREMRDARMAVGSNSASVWWLNGQEAVGLFNDRRMVMDDVMSDRLTLKKGRNVLRGAVINGPGLSQFCVRFLDADGRPIRDLKVDTQ